VIEIIGLVADCFVWIMAIKLYKSEILAVDSRQSVVGQVQNGATEQTVEVWLPLPLNYRQQAASAKSCGNYIGHSAGLRDC